MSAKNHDSEQSGSSSGILIAEQIAVYQADVFAQTKSLLQWEKVDFAKQKTDEVSLNAKQLLIHRCGGRQVVKSSATLFRNEINGRKIVKTFTRTRVNEVNYL